MFAKDVIAEIAAAAVALGVEPAALLAVAEIESGGKAFALVEGKPEPLIRFEAHYFDRRLAGSRRTQARAAGLASPLAGAIPNPRAQAARWKLLARAASIDSAAAHEAVSWGIGQVMGAHWKRLGYDSVEALVADARSGVTGQIRLMHRFIEDAGLSAALSSRDWHAFARGYNGPRYKRFQYHTRLAAAYRRHAGAPPPAAAPRPVDAGRPADASLPQTLDESSPQRMGFLFRLMSALRGG